jgi:hypothetical protein
MKLVEIRFTVCSARFHESITEMHGHYTFHKKDEIKNTRPKYQFVHIKGRQGNRKIDSGNTVNQNFFLKKQDHTKLSFDDLR